ncbi:hypothetical protein GPALN_014147 [Globodera pallida]|uniref:Uncharacterized protein n=1 Tax=Globodera rostochiensis TaxID=31243 RepID=A0A914H4N8_GLORO|nr:hypothetical protein GPALN_014147 [Globodera pallida]
MSIFGLIAIILLFNVILEPTLARKLSTKGCKVGEGNLTGDDGKSSKGRFKLCPKPLGRCAKNDIFGTTAYCIEPLT